MALDPSAVADPACRRLSRAGFGLAAALVLWAGLAGSQDLGALLKPYRTAEARGRAGSLRGTAFVGPLKPLEGATPLSGIPVVALPRSPRLLAELEAIKAHARDSAAHYLGAAGEVRRIKEAYEQALVGAGGADLILRAATDASGRFLFPRVPAGEWMLLARHEESHAKAARRLPSRDIRGGFVLEPLPAGYRTVTVWVLTRRVEPGAEVSVELHDRNPWFTGVEEIKTQGAIQQKAP